jgi:hypothetical protein
MPYIFNVFSSSLQPQLPGPTGPQAVPGSIGIPGQAFFGVGPIVPAGATFYPLFDELYDPIHLPSGSFC